MLLAVPLVLISLVLAWWLLIFLFPPQEKRLELALEGNFQKSRGAIVMYCVGGLTVLLWVTENFHGIPGAVVAFFPVALLPALGVVGKEEIRGISWEVLWLVAGGISLGYSLQDTGLAAWMITLVEWNALTPWMLIAGFLGISILLANFLSHTVTATLLIPVAMGLGTSGILGDGLSAVALAVAIAIGSSYGMSLPISTPPNAIAMSTGLVTTRQMAGFGVWMAIVGFFLTLAAALAFWPHVSKFL
jgi:sodium-dependent dicarboxylate transporter 2/3/5